MNHCDEFLSAAVLHKERTTQQRLFMLQFVQPGLAGLMDGSVSTLAPLFAAAFATYSVKLVRCSFFGRIASAFNACTKLM